MKPPSAECEEHGHVSIVMVGPRGRARGMIRLDQAKGKKGLVSEHVEPLPGVINVKDDLRNAVSMMFSHGATWLACIDDDGLLQGICDPARHHPAPRRELSGLIAMAASSISSAAGFSFSWESSRSARSCNRAAYCRASPATGRTSSICRASISNWSRSPAPSRPRSASRSGSLSPAVRSAPMRTRSRNSSISAPRSRHWPFSRSRCPCWASARRRRSSASWS